MPENSVSRDLFDVPVTWEYVSTLKPNPKNRNKHSPEQVTRLAKLIENFGWRQPIVVSKLSGLIVTGHGRLMAAQELGLEKVPVHYQDFANEEEEWSYGIADNGIAAWAELDLSGINADLPNFGPEFDLDLLGIDNFVLDPSEKESETTEKEASESEDKDKIPTELPPTTKVRIGDSFILGDSKLTCGDCLYVLKAMPDNSADSLLTDPPAGISFMGKEWDDDKGGRDEWIKWLESVMRECHRVLKPGAHGLVWALPRTSHWTATAIENAGFEVRDVITHLFGTGFPKSLDISKAIDKEAGAEREVVGKGVSGKTAIWQEDGGMGDFDITTPTTPAAKQWSGFGTSLKPAAEMWILIRKPISESTVAANVLKWGVGGLNIDGCRVGTAGGTTSSNFAKTGLFGIGEKADIQSIDAGRFPANLILDEQAAAALDEQSGISKSPTVGSRTKTKPRHSGSMAGAFDHSPEGMENGYGDTGGASRFFYIAKPSASEKNAGLDEMEEQTVDDGRDKSIDNPFQRGETLRKNIHPTVKPLALMSYLAKLITPPKGRILEPFGGSGTTLVASTQNGFSCLVAEMSELYCHIIIERWEHYSQSFAFRESDKLIWCEIKNSND